MSNWSEFTADAPQMATACAASFAAHRHHVLATIKADGAPRVSGTEAHVVGDDLWIGMMPDSAKLADVTRDPRVALHAAPIDVTMATGDVKVSGRLRLASDASVFLDYLGDQHGGEVPEGSMFVLDLDDVVRTTVEADELVVETWRPGRGVSTIRRH